MSWPEIGRSCTKWVFLCFQRIHSVGIVYCRESYFKWLNVASLCWTKHWPRQKMLFVYLPDAFANIFVVANIFACTTLPMQCFLVVYLWSIPLVTWFFCVTFRLVCLLRKIKSWYTTQEHCITGIDEINLAISQPNKFHPRIKCTAEISEKERNFIDTTTVKAKEFTTTQSSKFARISEWDIPIYALTLPYLHATRLGSFRDRKSVV